MATEQANPEARPYTAFNFRVEIAVDDVASSICGGSFAECDGLEMTMEAKSFREGGRNSGPVHLVGPVGYGQLTLRRGLTTNLDLWKWFEKVVASGSRGVRATAEVTLLAADGTTSAASFTLTGCLPVKLKAPSLNAKEGLVAVEEMQLAYETLRLKSPAGA